MVMGIRAGKRVIFCARSERNDLRALMGLTLDECGREGEAITDKKQTVWRGLWINACMQSCAHSRRGGAFWGRLVVGLPGILAQPLQARASQALGCAMTVRSVDVAPWSLTLTVHGLEVAGLPGQTPALSIERSYINASLISMLRLAACAGCH